MMKKIYTILVCLCMLAGFVACEKDKEFVLTTLSVTGEVLAPTYEAATIQCKLSADATISEAYVHYSLTSSFEDYEEVKMTLVNENYSALLLNLADNTTYYIRYEVSNKYSQVMSKSVNSFKTERLTTPTVLLGSLSEIQETQAKVVMSVVYDGGSSVTEMGVCWSTSSNPTKQNSHTRYDGFAIDAVLEITDLQPNTTYYVRAYAVNKVGVAYSEERSFTTLLDVQLPTLSTSTITQITETSAVAGGNVTGDGNASVTERGVVYSTNQNPTTADTKVAAGSGMGSFTCNLTDLQPNTTYYVRAYATNEKGTAYGEEVSFTTNKNIVLPSITTNVITQITETSAVAGGNVTSDGNASVTERGVVYSTNPNPVITNLYNTIKPCGSGTGSFTCDLTNLQPNTTYYVRAYATNSMGTAYGEEVSFTTEEEETVVSDPTGTENGYGYVDLGLSVKWATCNVGASSPEEYGDYFAWGETEPKSIYDWSTYKYCNGSNLTLTKYNTNSSYGIVDNKTQLELSDDAAYMNWGGAWRMPTDAEMTELREQCTWKWTSQNGMNGYRVTSNSNGNSIFLPAAGYRYESSLRYAGSDGDYWSSSLDTDYSNVWFVLFSSDYVYRRRTDRCWGKSVRPVLRESKEEVTDPTVTTAAITQITETTAVAGGNVTSDGNASVTERGIVYSTNPNPVITNLYNTIKPCGSGTGSFTCELTNLQPNTTYYVRAYATNSMGTAYGEEVSFISKKENIDNPPSNLTAMPFSVSASKQVYFSKGNLQYHPANDEWRFAENQTDYIGDANSNCSLTYNGWLDLFGWSTSATNFGVSTSASVADYSGTFVDWGTNKIGNDAPNTWRTLTAAEWNYLTDTRANAADLCGVAQVNGVNGLIFLPDNWVCPAGMTFKSGFYSVSGVPFYAAYQTFTAEQWSKLESAGAVFLPAAGRRYSSNVVSEQDYGDYWSATENLSENVYCFFFHSDVAGMGYDSRYGGQSVRLVKD